MNPADRLGEMVLAARRDRQPRSSAEATEVGLEDAYRIQVAHFGETTPCGYKLGLVSPAKQAQMRVANPILGRVSAQMLLGPSVDLTRFMQPRLEPELAIVLSAPLAPDATVGSLARTVGATFLAVDVLDTVWQDYRFSLPEVVADNSSGGGFLLGDRPLPFPSSGELRLLLAGEPATAGPVSALGDIRGHVAWLAREVGGLAAGTVIFLGSPAAAVPARPGLLELHGPGGSVMLASLEGPHHA